MLKEQRMVPVKVRLYCDGCGAEMRYMSSTLTYPQRHKHSCSGCGYNDYYDAVYPKIDYKEDDTITDTREFDGVLRSNNE